MFAARRWRSLQPLAAALVVLSVGLLAATLLHTDRFRWDYPPTWGWIVVYALAPVGVIVLARRQRAITDPARVADPGLRLLRVLSLVARRGAARPARLALFASPGDARPALAVAADAAAGAGRRRAGCAMIADALLWCAYDLRRASEAFIPYATLGAWCLRAAGAPGAARR